MAEQRFALNAGARVANIGLLFPALLMTLQFRKFPVAVLVLVLVVAWLAVNWWRTPGVVWIDEDGLRLGTWPGVRRLARRVAWSEVADLALQRKDRALWLVLMVRDGRTLQLSLDDFDRREALVAALVARHPFDTQAVHGYAPRVSLTQRALGPRVERIALWLVALVLSGMAAALWWAALRWWLA